MQLLRVSYTGTERGLTAQLVHKWQRGDIPVPIMSSNSGPKDTLRNWIYYAFAANKDVESILWLIGQYRHSVPFCIFRVAGHWHDCAGKQVSCRMLGEAA